KYPAYPAAPPPANDSCPANERRSPPETAVPPAQEAKNAWAQRQPQSSSHGRSSAARAARTLYLAWPLHCSAGLRCLQGNSRSVPTVLTLDVIAASILQGIVNSRQNRFR